AGASEADRCARAVGVGHAAHRVAVAVAAAGLADRAELVGHHRVRAGAVLADLIRGAVRVRVAARDAGSVDAHGAHHAVDVAGRRRRARAVLAGLARGAVRVDHARDDADAGVAADIAARTLGVARALDGLA